MNSEMILTQLKMKQKYWVSQVSVNKEWSNVGKNKREIIQKYLDGTTGHESLKF